MIFKKLLNFPLILIFELTFCSFFLDHNLILNENQRTKQDFGDKNFVKNTHKYASYIVFILQMNLKLNKIIRCQMMTYLEVRETKRLKNDDYAKNCIEATNRIITIFKAHTLFKFLWFLFIFMFYYFLFVFRW